MKNFPKIFFLKTQYILFGEIFSNHMCPKSLGFGNLIKDKITFSHLTDDEKYHYSTKANLGIY